MVSKTEESEVNKLENQVDNGGGGAWEYLSLVRKLKLRRSNQVLKHGLSILNNSNLRSSLGPDGNYPHNSLIIHTLIHFNMCFCCDFLDLSCFYASNFSRISKSFRRKCIYVVVRINEILGSLLLVGELV